MGKWIHPEAIIICKNCGWVSKDSKLSECKKCKHLEFWYVSREYHEFPRSETFAETWRP